MLTFLGDGGPTGVVEPPGRISGTKVSPVVEGPVGTTDGNMAGVWFIASLIFYTDVDTFTRGVCTDTLKGAPEGVVADGY